MAVKLWLWSNLELLVQIIILIKWHFRQLSEWICCWNVLDNTWVIFVLFFAFIAEKTLGNDRRSDIRTSWRCNPLRISMWYLAKILRLKLWREQNCWVRFIPTLNQWTQLLMRLSGFFFERINELAVLASAKHYFKATRFEKVVWISWLMKLGRFDLHLLLHEHAAMKAIERSGLNSVSTLLYIPLCLQKFRLNRLFSFVDGASTV